MTTLVGILVFDGVVAYGGLFFSLDVGDAEPSFIKLDGNIDSNKGYTTVIFTVREYHSPCKLR